MKIKDIKTTLVSIPYRGGFQDATMRRPAMGQMRCFVHIVVDSGLEGLAPAGGGPGVQQLINS